MLSFRYIQCAFSLGAADQGLISRDECLWQVCQERGCLVSADQLAADLASRVLRSTQHGGKESQQVGRDLDMHVHSGRVPHHLRRLQLCMQSAGMQGARVSWQRIWGASIPEYCMARNFCFLHMPEGTRLYRAGVHVEVGAHVVF